MCDNGSPDLPQYGINPLLWALRTVRSFSVRYEQKIIVLLIVGHAGIWSLLELLYASGNSQGTSGQPQPGNDVDGKRQYCTSLPPG